MAISPFEKTFIFFSYLIATDVQDIWLASSVPVKYIYKTLFFSIILSRMTLLIEAVD